MEWEWEALEWAEWEVVWVTQEVVPIHGKMVEWEDLEGAELLLREGMEEAIATMRVPATVVEEVGWEVVVVVDEEEQQSA